MTGEQRSGAMATTPVAAITEYLERMGIAHDLVEHEPVMSAAAEAHAMHYPTDEVAKTIVLTDGYTNLIAAIPATQRLDLHKLRAVLGASRKLQLASEEQIARDVPSLEVGAVPPFGPMVPAAEVIDQALLGHERVLCPAGDHRHSVLVDPKDVLRITSARTADICQD